MPAMSKLSAVAVTGAALTAASAFVAPNAREQTSQALIAAKPRFFLDMLLKLPQTT